MNRLLTLGIAAVPALLHAQGSLTVGDRPLHPMPKGFYGLMTEEINHSYDGGLYGELVRNRALKDDPNGPAHWTAVGGRIEMREVSVPGTALTRALRVEGGGVANDGFWGIPIRPNTTYRATLWVRADSPTSLGVMLEKAEGGPSYAMAEVKGVRGEWRKVELTLKTTAATPTTVGRLRIVAHGAFDLAEVSLFGPTYKNRSNGNRSDLMELLAGMRPSFLRLPGGNYLEGNTIAERFQWKETLGRIEDRPGHQAPWGYRSSDGLGLLEYLYWCEDLKMKPLLAVYAGYSLGGQRIEPGPALTPYVQDALDEIEFVTGDPKTTKWGAMRAKLGHSRPFPLEYVEIGNEDNFDRSGSYDGRFAQFHDAIKAKYPKLQTIASAGVKSRVPDVVDDHYYRTAAEMARDSDHYRKADRKGPKIFVGEWASLEGEPTPDFQAALGDAAWLTGLERDSDLVIMEAYAPLFSNLNPGAFQWNTNLIGYDALRSFGSPSYWVQALFAQNTGDEVLPVTVVAGKPPEALGYHGGMGVVAVPGVGYRDPRVSDSAAGSDFAAWSLRGARIEGEVLKGGAERRPTVALYEAPTFVDGTFTVLARCDGQGGFGVVFHATDTRNLWQWNVGGATNEIRHQEVFSNRVVAKGEPVAVAEAKWVELKIEVRGGHVRGYVDGRLAIEMDENAPAVGPVYASATRKGGETILKVVNLSATDTPLTLDLGGSRKTYAIKGLVMTGPLVAKTNLEEPLGLSPRPVAETVLRAGEPYRFPAHSVTVLRLKAR